VTLPVSRKKQREQAKEVQRVDQAAKATSPSSKSLLKRKRSDVDESDPKLKEFLEVMWPKSKPKTWEAEETQAPAIEEPPRKVQALELPEEGSDSEYDVVPKKPLKKATSPLPNNTVVTVVPAAEAEPSESLDTEAQNKPTPVRDELEATDDDWLRSRTNRLLDLVEPADAFAKKGSNNGFQLPSPLEIPEDVEIANSQEITTEQAIEHEVPSDGPDPTIEAIQARGRLFVRNLPYSATEDDLRKHFETYGVLEEVFTFSPLILVSAAS